jgi:hypothetical protein
MRTEPGAGIGGRWWPYLREYTRWALSPSRGELWGELVDCGLSPGCIVRVVCAALRAVDEDAVAVLAQEIVEDFDAFAARVRAACPVEFWDELLDRFNSADPREQ